MEADRKDMMIGEEFHLNVNSILIYNGRVNFDCYAFTLIFDYKPDRTIYISTRTQGNNIVKLNDNKNLIFSNFKQYRNGQNIEFDLVKS